MSSNIRGGVACQKRADKINRARTAFFEIGYAWKVFLLPGVFYTNQSVGREVELSATWRFGI